MITPEVASLALLCVWSSWSSVFSVSSSQSKVSALDSSMKTFTRTHYAAGGAQALPERARVVRILVEDGAEVEEGTPLFALE